MAVALLAAAACSTGGAPATSDEVATADGGAATTMTTGTRPDPATTGTAVPATTVSAVTPPTSGLPAATLPATTLPSGAARRPVLRFADPASVSGWITVDDTVMGGRSDGDVRWAGGALVFAGVVSLENNGGFSSVRSPFDPAIGAAIGDADELLLDVTGDGKTYVLQLRSGPAGQWLHIARFTTAAGQARTEVLSIDAFEPVGSRLDPRPSTPPLDPATVVQVTVYVLDKQVGPFSLALRSLDAR